MFYSLIDAQGILDVVNIEATTYGLAPSATIVTTMVSYLALIVEMPTPASEVDQLTNIVATLLVR